MLHASQRAIIFAIAMLAVIAPVSLRAHDADFALTTIEWNEAEDTLEIIHRLNTHHAFDAAALALTPSDGDFMSLKNLAALGLYVERHFALFDAQGIAIELEFVGAETQGDYALVYQEAKLVRAPDVLGVRNDILKDVQPGQINHVNITRRGKTRTLIFADESSVSIWEDEGP